MPWRGFGSGVTTQQVAQTATAVATSQRLYSQMTPLAGDTLSAGTTAEQPFASNYTIPANSLVVGQELVMRGAGVYTSSALAPPTQRARLRTGASGPVFIDSGPVGVLLSLTSARYMFSMHLLVRSLGVNGTIEAFGRLEFAQTLSAATVVLCGPSGAVTDAGNPVTVDTTQPIPLVLTTTYSYAAAGNSNSMRQISLSTLRPVSM